MSHMTQDKRTRSSGTAAAKRETEPDRTNPGEPLPVGGDHERAFAECFARVYERFKRYTWAALRNSETAEEAVQSTLVAIGQRHFLGTENRFVEAEPLAFRMLNLRVSKQNHERLRHATSQNRFPSWTEKAKRLMPRKARGHATLDDVVESALAEMSPRCREVFLLRREALMSFKEIAALCNTGPRSVSALMHRAQSVLREHVAKAGFGSADRQRAADTGRWRIAKFIREPDFYESQEAIIERDGNPDSALLSDYIAGELSSRKTVEVAQRLEQDAEFRALAEPLLMAWSVPPTSAPVSREELVNAWLQVRAMSGLAAIPGHPTP